MVKKWLIILITAIFLVVSCVLESKFVNDTFDNLVDNLNNYKTMLDDSGDNVCTQSNLEYIKYLHDDFHESEKVLKMLIWHTGLKDIEVGMSRIIEYVEENDRTEALVETNALIDYCKHYSLDFGVVIENIL